MDIFRQIETGALVCPRIRQPLRWEGNKSLVSQDGQHRYRMVKGTVPVLLEDEDWAAQYAASSEQMSSEYTPRLSHRLALKARLRAALAREYRLPAAETAFRRLFDGQVDDALCLSVGGGPTRPHPSLTNLNIAPFPNVEVVADAHLLPYADGSVDAIYCEAVLEHLSDPDQAVREMHRVLKPGGQVFAVTPFLQAYHGYPSHFQNFTITGHQQLFLARGFTVSEAGPCVGPVNAWITLNAVFLRQYLPRPFGALLALLWQAVSAPLRVLDRRLTAAANGYVFASTTYVLARKAVAETTED